MLVTLIEAEPAAACAFKAYFPAVPAEAWFKTTTSVAAIVEFVRVKETMASAAKAALLSVTVPHFLPLDQQSDLALKLVQAGANWIQTEGGTSSKPFSPGILPVRNSLAFNLLPR